MKTFRAEKQSKNASTQVIVTLIVLFMSIVLVRLLPTSGKLENSNTDHSTWETSVIKLP